MFGLDNGPQFTSREFADFLAANGVQHLRSAPYHPATNGAAERFVQTFKQALRAGKEDQGSLRQKLARFLMVYRNTPHSTTGVPPAELFLKRRPRTRLDVMRPSTGDQVLLKQVEQKRVHDKRCRPREFVVGQAVLVRNVRDGSKWLPGEVCAKTGPVSYEVNVCGQVWRRHAEQLLSQSNSMYQQPDAPFPTEVDVEVPSLGAPPRPTTQPEVESMAPDNTDSGPMVGTEVASASQETPSNGQVAEPEAQASPPPVVRASESLTLAHTCTPTVTKTYPRRDRRPCIRFEPTF